MLFLAKLTEGLVGDIPGQTNVTEVLESILVDELKVAIWQWLDDTNELTDLGETT